MSRLLKRNGAANAPQVHSLMSALATAADGSAGAPLPVIDPERVALAAELQSLKLRLEQRDVQLSDLRAEVKSAFETGEAKGREAGLREATVQDAQRLARLEAGIDQALAAFKQSLAGLERLAPALAHEAIAGILGELDARPALVAAIVRNQMKAVDARSVIHIEVSAADFTDDQALEALDGTFGTAGPVVHASVALKSGDCRIKLKLGTLDVGLDQQWGRLGALLLEMAEPAGRGA